MSLINALYFCIFWLIIFPIALIFAGFAIVLKIIIGLLIDMLEACSQIVGFLFGINEDDDEEDEEDEEDFE